MTTTEQISNYFAAFDALIKIVDVEDHDVVSVTIKVRDLVPIVRKARAAKIALKKHIAKNNAD